MRAYLASSITDLAKVETFSDIFFRVSNLRGATLPYPGINDFQVKRSFYDVIYNKINCSLSSREDIFQRFRTAPDRDIGHRYAYNLSTTVGVSLTISTKEMSMPVRHNTCIPSVATCVSYETCFDFLSFRSDRPSSRLIYVARVGDAPVSRTEAKGKTINYSCLN